MTTTLEHAKNALIQRHQIQDDFSHAIGHLCDWQEDLESGPDDDAQEWQDLLSTVMTARKALFKLKNHLHALPVDPVAWEAVYGD